MKYIKLHACCFFEHRKINETPELVERLAKTIEMLITDKGVNKYNYKYF